jgi:hypothetical protein
VVAVAPNPRRSRLPGGDHRLPDLRHDDRPGLLVGIDRLVTLVGLGSQGDRRPRHMARPAGSRRGRPSAGYRRGRAPRRGTPSES